MTEKQSKKLTGKAYCPRPPGPYPGKEVKLSIISQKSEQHQKEVPVT